MAEAEHNEDGKHATPVVVDEKVGLSEEDAGQCTAQDQPDIDYPPFRKVLVIMFGLFIAAFLVALDRTIIGTAIPKITDDFHSLGDVGWYASAYLLTMCGSQPSMGRIYTFFDLKRVFLSTIVVFEIGSAICGAAPNSTVFIVGRAIAGLGAAGVFSGAIPIFIYILPLEKRPAWTGLFGMVFGIASVAGPLLGGLFTDNVSWRWCFYINLPIGAVTFAIIFLILHLPEQKREELTVKQQIDRLDPVGTLVFFGSIVCLLLALQWGGTVYAWGSGRIVALLVLFGASFVFFWIWQHLRKDSALVPIRFLANRNVSAGMFFAFCTGCTMFTAVYYLPIWFQAIKSVSAVKSGIMNMPMILGLVVASIVAGFLTKKIGYYLPWMYICIVLMPIGMGLISTFAVDTDHEKWIGCQVLLGFGIGIGCPNRDGFDLLHSSLGGAIATSVANNIFTNKLAQGLARIPGVDIGTVANVGATDLRHFVPPSTLPQVLTVYNKALVHAFDVGVAFSSLAIFGTLPMQWKSIRKSENSSKSQAKGSSVMMPKTPVTKDVGE